MAALFLTNGACSPTCCRGIRRSSPISALSNAHYGVAIAAFSAGALVAGPAAAALIRRFRSSRVAVAGSLGIAVFILVAALAPSAVTLAAALFVAGAADSVTDVGQNAHALRLQRNYGRSIINSLHAVWSAGAVLGGAMGAAAIALDIPRTTHLAVSAALFSAVVLAAYPFLLRGPDEADHPSAGAADRGPTRLRGIRHAGRAGVHRDRGRAGRGRRKLMGHSVFAGWAGCAGRARGVWLHCDGRVPVRGADDRRPAGRQVRRARRREGRRTHHRGGDGRWRWRSPAFPARSPASRRRVSESPPSFPPPCTAPISCPA